MLSLYIHIPFCQTKCKYCSFQVCPADQMKTGLFDIEIKKYIDSVISEIQTYSQLLKDKELKSIYFGWGTPQLIWLENLEKIIDAIIQNFDTENLWEFSMEMNPYPKDETIAIVQSLSSKYRMFSRVRFSFGIQSFDNKVLSMSWRDITYPGLVDFFRDLQPIKRSNNIFNLDFIAFGQFNESRKWNFQLWNPNTLDFYERLAESKFVDSYSLYTLELFPGSLWYYQKDIAPIKKGGKYGLGSQEHNPIIKDDNDLSGTAYWDDDDIYEEFSILKDILLDRGYRRYEISNFSLLWKSSIHNRAYRDMSDYIGIWTSAASFFQNPNPELMKYLDLPEDTKAVRWTNTVKLADYNNEKYLDWESIQKLTDKDLLIEQFFLWLRTDIWINDLAKYFPVLVKDIEQRIESYTKQWFIEYKENGIRLTDSGMDIYNDIVTELLEEI